MAVCSRSGSNTTLLSLLFSIFVVATYGFREDWIKNDGQVEKSLRLKKYKDIWSKAQTKSFSDQKLLRLEKILYKLDKMELNLKHTNSDVQKKSKVQEYLDQVLKEYDLHEDAMPDNKDVHFQDYRINRLWQDAVGEGAYTKDELHSLYQEMRHMEKKIKEVHALARDAADLHGTGDGMDSDVLENMVGSMEAEELKKAKETTEQLKEKQEAIDKEVGHMAEKVRNKTKAEFSDDRVLRLWDSAQKAIFTEDELLTVREELKHFQKHIDKLDHWENINSKIQGKGGADEVTHAQLKLDEYQKKVKKYHKTMLRKIKEKTEL